MFFFIVQKLFSRRTVRHLFLALCPLTPIALLAVPGCGGGSSNASLPITIPTSNLYLGNGQTGDLALVRSGGRLSGTISVSTLSVSQVPGRITPGVYPVSGTLTDNKFSLTGTFPSLGQFTLTGTLPTQTVEGSFHSTIGGTTGFGLIAPIGGYMITPTITAAPTVTPTGTTSSTPTGTV